jgi:hypothetical protein
VILSTEEDKKVYKVEQDIQPGVYMAIRNIEGQYIGIFGANLTAQK